MSHFIILGLGNSGSSLLHSLLDQHSQTEVWFEDYTFDYWEKRQANLEIQNKIWGNKVIHDVLMRHRRPFEVKRLFEDMKVIDNRRPLKGFLDSCARRWGTKRITLDPAEKEGNIHEIDSNNVFFMNEQINK